MIVARERAQVVLGGAPLEVWKDDFGVVWGYLTDWLNTGKGCVRLSGPPRVLCVLSVRRAVRCLSARTRLRDERWRAADYCSELAAKYIKLAWTVYRSERL